MATSATDFAQKTAGAGGSAPPLPAPRTIPGDAAPPHPAAGAIPGDAAPQHPVAAEIELAAVLHALSDPIRLKIVATLAGGGEHTCSSIDLPVVKSTCTHHFRVLREAGVIRVRLEGKTRLNSLRRDELEQRFPGLVDAVLGATPTADR